MKTIAELRARHETEERKLVLEALSQSDYRLTRAAERLGVSPSSLQSIVARLDLKGQMARSGHRRGRPTVTA